MTIGSHRESPRPPTALFALFCLLFLSHAYFFHAGGHNENARYDHVRALVEEGTNAIGTYANTADVVRHEGQTYSNKPPGLVYLALFPWWVFRKIFDLLRLDEALTLHLLCVVTAQLTVGLVSALLGLILHRVLARFLPEPHAVLLTLAYALGTLAFPNSNLFISHQLTAALSLLSFLLVMQLRDAPAAQEGGSTRQTGFRFATRNRLLLAGSQILRDESIFTTKVLRERGSIWDGSFSVIVLVQKIRVP